MIPSDLLGKSPVHFYLYYPPGISIKLGNNSFSHIYGNINGPNDPGSTTYTEKNKSLFKLTTSFNTCEITLLYMNQIFLFVQFFATHPNCVLLFALGLQGEKPTNIRYIFLEITTETEETTS